MLYDIIAPDNYTAAWNQFVAMSTERRQRLFACACCRQVLTRLTQDSIRELLNRSEQHADSPLDLPSLFLSISRVAELGIPRGTADWFFANAVMSTGFGDPNEWRNVPLFIAAGGAWRLDSCGAPGFDEQIYSAEVSRQLLLLDDFLAPSLVTDLTKCITPTVRALATTIYSEHAFDLFPVLGDAIEEAGCTERSVLEHCRSSKAHARGCWLLDIIRGEQLSVMTRPG
jgi:hypothetical protein